MSFRACLSGALVVTLATALGCASSSGQAQSARSKTSVRVIKPGEPGNTPRDFNPVPVAYGPGTLAAPPATGLPEPEITHVHDLPKTHIAPTHPVAVASLDQWTARYPDAARELGDWMKKYPECSRDLMELDTVRADALRVLTEWAITHRYESVRAFLFERFGWEKLRAMLDEGRTEGVEAYLAWVRRSQDAAMELVSHSRGLEAVARRDFGVEPVRAAQR
jgi:hypothetical protein